MRAVNVIDVKVAENTATNALAVVTASSVMAALYVPSAMATRVVHVRNAAVLEIVRIVAVAPNAINAMVSDKSIMDITLTTGRNVLYAAEVEGVFNVLEGNAGIVKEQEYGNAAFVVETERATHVMVADCARFVKGTRHIAMFVLTVMESAPRVKVRVIHGNTVLMQT